MSFEGGQCEVQPDTFGEKKEGILECSRDKRKQPGLQLAGLWSYIPESPYIIGPELVKEQITTNMISVQKNISSEKQEQIKAEITRFLDKPENKEILSNLSKVGNISIIGQQALIILLYFKKKDPNSKVEYRLGIQDIKLSSAQRSLYGIYSNKFTNPLLKNFLMAYTSGEFPILKEEFEKQNPIIKQLKPYYPLLSDPKVIDTLMEIFKDSEKLRKWFENASKALERIIKIVHTNYAPEPYSWEKDWRHFLPKGRRDKVKWGHMKETLLPVIKDFIEILTPFLGALRNFFKGNPEMWQYFLEEGLGLEDKAKTFLQKGKKSTEQFIKQRIFKGKYKELTPDDIFSHILLKPEVLQLFIISIFINIYGLWANIRNSEEIQGLLSKSGVPLNAWWFRNTEELIALLAPSNKLKDVKEKLEKLIFLLQILGTDPTWEDLQKALQGKQNK